MFTNYLKQAFLAFLVFHGLVCSPADTVLIPTEYGETISISVSEFIAILHHKKQTGGKLSATEALYLKTCLYEAQQVELRKRAFDMLVKRVGEVEVSMDEQGYVTFAHGRSWEWNFVNDIWNLICAVKARAQEMSDRISLRYRDQHCDIEQLLEYRKELLKYGTNYHVGSASHCEGKEAEITFMSRTLVSHDNYTADYFLHNNSFGNGAYNFAVNLLKDHGLEQYEDHISKLYALHKKSSDCGEMLCISVHKDHLNDLVYVAEYGGFKHSTDLTCLEQVQACQENVSDGDEFMDDRENSTSSIYCFAVSDLPGEYGNKYTITSVHLTKQQKYQEYKQELQKLFDEMKNNPIVTENINNQQEIQEVCSESNLGLLATCKEWAEDCLDCAEDCYIYTRNVLKYILLGG